jgi:hypothetical protein
MHARIVNRQQAPVFLGLCGDPANVGDFECGIRGRFQPKEFRCFPKGEWLFRAGHVHKVNGNSHGWTDDATKVALRPAVHIVDAQYVIAVCEQVHDGRGRRTARAKGDTINSLFRRRHGPFKGASRRISCPRILVAQSKAVGVVDAGRFTGLFLFECCCQTDRCDNSARRIPNVTRITRIVQIRSALTPVRVWRDKKRMNDC